MYFQLKNEKTLKGIIIKRDHTDLVRENVFHAVISHSVPLDIYTCIIFYMERDSDNTKYANDKQRLILLRSKIPTVK